MLYGKKKKYVQSMLLSSVPAFTVSLCVTFVVVSINIIIVVVTVDGILVFAVVCHVLL